MNYLDNMITRRSDGKVCWRMYWMHGCRFHDATKETGAWIEYCGATFSAAIWEERTTNAGRAVWYCKPCESKVKECFPEDYARYRNKHPVGWHAPDFGCCGMKWFPWRDTPYRKPFWYPDNENGLKRPKGSARQSP